MATDQLDDDDARRWREALSRAERAQLELRRAQLDVEGLSLEFRDRYGLQLGTHAEDPHADRIDLQGRIMRAGVAPRPRPLRGVP